MEESHFSCLRLACSRLLLSGDEQKEKKWKEERWRVFERLPLSSAHVLLSFISRAPFFWPHWTNTITSRCSGNEPALLVLLGEDRESSGNRVYFTESSNRIQRLHKRSWKERAEASVKMECEGLRRNFYPHAKHTREARTVPDLPVSSDLAQKKKKKKKKRTNLFECQWI